MDVVAMETTSCDHMTRALSQSWWRREKPAVVGVLDELPLRETCWREEEIVGGVCEEVMRGAGGRVRTHPHHDPISWSHFTRSVSGSVLHTHTHTHTHTQTAERCRL